MKRNKASKAGSIFLIAVLALAGVGITYAGFTDTVAVYGSANTARVQFEELEYTGTWVYKVWGCEDAPADEIVVTDDPNYNPLNDYPNCQYELVSWAESYPGTGDNDVEVDFHNLMPSVEYVADLHFKVGTLPVKVSKLEYGLISGDEWITPLIQNGDIYGTMYTDTGKIIEEGSQIHAYEKVSLELHISIPQDNFYQGREGSFYMNMEIVQWTDPCGYVPNPKGSIEVHKETIPDGSNTEFEFTVTGPDTNEVFTLSDGDHFTVGNLDLGTYTVTETIPADWDLTDIDISGDYQSDSTGANSITFELLEGNAIVTFNNEEKPITLKATKIICPSKDCLPEWGNDPNQPPMVTESLINDFLSNHPDCYVDPNWEFEWGFYGQVTDPITDYSDTASQYGYGGGNWNTFTGSETIKISDIPSGVDRICTREVLEDGYIPFAGKTDDPGDGSAELYAHTDIYKFDNYDYVDISSCNPGDVYHMVGFNAPVEKTLTIPTEMNVYMKHYGETESYWNVTINSIVGTGPWSNPIEVGAHLRGWCVDQYTTIIEGNYDVTLHFDDRELIQPGNDHAPTGITDWDCVDYIINHDDGYSRISVQYAIWYYVNGGHYPSDSDAQAIIADVNANAVDWVNNGRPTGDDPLWLAVIIDAGCDVQLNIIEVDP